MRGRIVEAGRGSEVHIYMRLHLSKIHLQRSSLDILPECTVSRTRKQTIKKATKHGRRSFTARKQKNNSLQPLVVQVLVHGCSPLTALHSTALRLLHGTGHLDCARHRITDTTRHDTTQEYDGNLKQVSTHSSRLKMHNCNVR